MIKSRDHPQVLCHEKQAEITDLAICEGNSPTRELLGRWKRTVAKKIRLTYQAARNA